MTLNFLSWMVHPDITKGTTFEFPNFLLALQNGHIILLEETQMNIFNNNFVPLQQPMYGTFIGLSEGTNGSLLTIQLPESQTEKKLSVKKLNLIGEKYCWSSGYGD